MVFPHSETTERTDAGLAPAPSFRFFPTAAPLCHFVEYLYCSDVPAQFASRVEAMRLPELQAQLVFAIEDGGAFPGGMDLDGGRRASLFLQPAHLQFIPIPGSIRSAVGASLRPAGLRLLLPAGSECATEAPLFALEDLWGADARSLLERLVIAGTPRARLVLLESYLRARVRRVGLPSRPVTHAFDMMQAAHGEISTEQLARACGCSSRTLRSLTMAEAGLAPKQMARIVRIRHALELLRDAGVPLSAAAATSAFSDHAHMSREFRELLGETPSQLGPRMRSPAIPRINAERSLTSTGLLVVPKPSRS
jgi:AraC-like DNA-binding protein